MRWLITINVVLVFPLFSLSSNQIENGRHNQLRVNYLNGHQSHFRIPST